MDIIKLRVMTEKSIIGFGKYENMSVGNCLALKMITDLRWIYYNCSTLSFNEDILATLGITDEWKIEKPGKDTEKGILLRDDKKSKRPKAFLDNINKKAEKKFKNDRWQRIKLERIRYSKSYMQALNHGHSMK